MVVGLYGIVVPEVNRSEKAPTCILAGAFSCVVLCLLLLSDVVYTLGKEVVPCLS